ncbi:hypothetical protein CYY_009938 [Polysphondylium violaceum]|uniref:MYND-type domain-containing protein n=1 Tax=Polysphondylium violaceum TaxID=133409 RepID=A0A8J4PJN5_9MYCE|nr:hypothetical protein CYY_009938 [Polysphondylium violaceum]
MNNRDSSTTKNTTTTTTASTKTPTAGKTSSAADTTTNHNENDEETVVDPSKHPILFEFMPHVVYILNDTSSSNNLVVENNTGNNNNNNSGGSKTTTTSAPAGTTADNGEDNQNMKKTLNRGVVMIVMLNGDVFFYPISLGHLDLLPNQLAKNTGDTNDSGAKSNKNKYSKYNISLNLSAEHKVFSLNFQEQDPTSTFIYKYNKANSNSNKNNSNTTATGTESSTPAPPAPTKQTTRYRKPRKIILSHDKRLLMIIGCFYKGISCLTVYRILEDGPDHFQLIYYDSSFTFIDACFSSDSKMLACILSRYPNFIFFLQLPSPSVHNILNNKQLCNHNVVATNSNNSSSNSNNINYNQFISLNSTTNNISTPTIVNTIGGLQQTLNFLHNNNNIANSGSNNNNNTSNNNSNSNSNTKNSETKFIDTLEYSSKRVSFEPRRVGPMAIVGPIKNSLGQPYQMTHITSNPYPQFSEKVKAFEYVTWNDDGLGECCFWNIYKDTLTQPKNSNNNNNSTNNNSNNPLKQFPTLKFEWMTKFVGPIVPDKTWIEKESSPKSFIMNMEFSPLGNLVMVLVKRENHDHKSKTSNGIGYLCMPSTIELLGFNSSNSNNDNDNNNFYYKHFGQSDISLNHTIIYGGANIKRNALTTSSSTTSSSKNNTIGGEVCSTWFQLTPSFDKSAVLVTKWTDSLFFGGVLQYLPSALIKDKGIYELISNTYCVQFTNASEDFIRNCMNFIQIGKYHRLWISNNANLYLITMTPKNDEFIEWIKVFDLSVSTNNNSIITTTTNTNTTSSSSASTTTTNNNNVISKENQVLLSKYYKLSQMIGYNLIDFRQCKEPTSSNQQQQPLSSKNQKKKKIDDLLATITSNVNPISEKSGRSDGEIYQCLHLYKCWNCKLTLMKPLICGYCKSSAYCSKDCQTEHWPFHKPLCSPPNFPSQSNI